MAIDPVSIALANSVTARPPGIASVHFNPAGLTKIPEGKTKASGFTIAQVVRKVTTYPDLEWGGLMDTFGPEQNGQRPDPFWYTEGTSTSTDFYIPGKGAIHFSPVMALPTSAQAYKKPGSRWAFGRAVVAAFSGGFSHKQNLDPNYFFARELYSQRINYLSPGVGYQVSDTFSVGLTVAAGMTNLGVKGYRRSPSHMTALTKVLGEATEELNIPVISQETYPPPWFGGGISPWEPVLEIDVKMNDFFSPSFNVGMLWEPTKYFSWGVVYQSPIRNELSGDFVISYTTPFRRMVDWFGSSPLLDIQSAMLDLPTQSVPYQKGTVTMLYTLPQRIQTGIMVQPIKKLRLMFDVHWANWSTWHEQRLEFDQDIQAFRVAKLSGHTEGNRATAQETGLKDTFHFSYGLEFDVSKKLTLRCGYEDRQSSVDINMFSLSSLPDVQKYGVGFGLKFGNGATLDLGYTFFRTGDYWIPNDTSDNLNSTKFTKSSTSQYVGSDVKFNFHGHILSFSIAKPVMVPEETATRKKEKFKSLKRNMKIYLGNFKSMLGLSKKK